MNRETFGDRYLARVWVGRSRRVGICVWGTKDGVPLTSLALTDGPLGQDRGLGHEFNRKPGQLLWFRIPGTRYCLGTYNRGDRR